MMDSRCASAACARGGLVRVEAGVCEGKRAHPADLVELVLVAVELVECGAVRVEEGVVVVAVCGVVEGVCVERCAVGDGLEYRLDCGHVR